MIKNGLNKGFTLMELSITLVVLGITIYSAVAIYTKRVEISRIADTTEKLKVIENALRSYYLKNGTLPCPADGTLTTGAAAFGVASVAANCGSSTDSNTGIYSISGNSVYMGVVPTRTLNLQDSYMLDDWGNRITYVVADDFSNGSWDINGTINVSNTAGGSFTTEAVYIIISYGKDGIGAWRRAGGTARIEAQTKTSDFELENAHINTSGAHTAWDDEFYDDVINDGDVTAAGKLTKYFDDIVKWKTADQVDYDSRFE